MKIIRVLSAIDYETTTQTIWKFFHWQVTLNAKEEN